MSKVSIMFAAWAALSGALIPVFAALNGRLGKIIGNVPYSVLAASLAGLTGAIIFVLVTKAEIPSPTIIAKTPLIYFAGGLIPLFYMISATYLAPRFGVANTVFFVVAAQIISAAIIDHFGLFGADRMPLDTRRTLGIFLLFAGVILARAAPINTAN